MNANANRRPYQGVLQILQFNWRSYAVTLAGIGVAALAWPFLPPVARMLMVLATSPALFWMASSLVVSHYVYDRFPLYDLTWMARALSRTPRRWINIHAGLDETSGLLVKVFPDAEGSVVDIFDPRVMTEPSIRKARQIAHASSHADAPATPARYDALPFPGDSFDAAFAIFAAHELRHHDQRVKLFAEVARILAPGGEMVLVEHSRDWPNFLAFGPGFLHFLSKRAWRDAASDANLELRSEFSMTPFVHAYVLRRTI